MVCLGCSRKRSRQAEALECDFRDALDTGGIGRFAARVRVVCDANNRRKTRSPNASETRLRNASPRCTASIGRSSLHAKPEVKSPARDALRSGA
jgi:hypothetical protein